MHRYIKFLRFKSAVVVIMTLLLRYALAFVVVPILSKELDDFVKDWNSHRIRPVSGAVSPSGIPKDLYAMPHLHGIILSLNCN